MQKNGCRFPRQPSALLKISLDKAVQQGQALAAVQLADGLCLDLADALTGDAEVAAHLFQRAGTAIVQTKAETDDLLFTGSQLLRA